MIYLLPSLALAAWSMALLLCMVGAQAAGVFLLAVGTFVFALDRILTRVDGP